MSDENDQNQAFTFTGQFKFRPVAMLGGTFTAVFAAISVSLGLDLSTGQDRSLYQAYNEIVRTNERIDDLSASLEEHRGFTILSLEQLDHASQRCQENVRGLESYREEHRNFQLRKGEEIARTLAAFEERFKNTDRLISECMQLHRLEQRRYNE